jgi:hypothetical protein
LVRTGIGAKRRWPFDLHGVFGIVKENGSGAKRRETVEKRGIGDGARSQRLRPLPFSAGETRARFSALRLFAASLDAATLSIARYGIWRLFRA